MFCCGHNGLFLGSETNKKISNRFDIYFCFRNKFLMLQIRLKKKSSGPNKLSRICATYFFSTLRAQCAIGAKWNRVTQSSYCIHNSLFSLSKSKSQILFHELGKYFLCDWIILLLQSHGNLFPCLFQRGSSYWKGQMCIK